MRWLPALLWLILLPVQAQDDDQQAQLDKLIAEIGRLQEALNDYRGERDAELEQLQQLEQRIDQLHRDMRATDRSIAEGEQRLVELAAERERLEAARAAQQQRVAEELRALHRNGSSEPLKLLLNQEDPQQFSRMLRFYGYLLEARSSRIDEFLETMQQIDANRVEQQQRQQQLAGDRAAIERQQAELGERRGERQLVLDRLEASIGDTARQIEEKQRDRERLEELIREVQEQIANLRAPEDVQPFADLKGEMNWPADGRRRNAFGGVRTGSLRWSGIVIDADRGAPVSVIHYGRVVFADYLRGFGLLVIVDHGDGFMSLYGQNESLLVEAGDWLRRGQQVATAGGSGGAEQDGLYFEIRSAGKPVDPVVWCD